MKPAPWYLDEGGGQKKGPFTSQEIMKLVMDGALKVESRIYDADSDTWKIAADVVPYLDLNPPLHGADEKNWQPPPRPTDLRDTHIVDLNEEATGNIDYFALINDRKKELEKARTTKTAATASATAERRPAQGAPRFLNADRKLQPTAKPEPEKTSRPQLAELPSGIMIAEPEKNIVVRSIFSARNYMKAHKTAFAMAAAMAFVFIGTYGLIRSYIEKKSREPATTIQQQKLNQAPAPGASNLSNVASEPVTPPSEGLGSGRNKVTKSRASIPETIQEASQFSKVVPGMPNPPIAAPQNQEPLREPPQYYSTGDENAGGQQVAVGTPPADYNPNANTDPNSGVVNPPGFIPMPPANSQFAPQAPDQGNSPFPAPNPNDPNDPNNNPQQPPQNSQY